jgi:hypothetical protein
MGLGSTVGADLLAVPFPKMVFDLARSIAKGQTALDRASLATLRVLANTNFDYIPEITEVISKGPETTVGGVTVTGVDANVVTPIRSVPLSLLQAGMMPTFYQFTESLIEVKMAISAKTSTQSEFEFGVQVEASAGFLFASATVTSHVDFRTSNTYSYSAEGSSLLRTTLKPVPPPPRFMPRFITVNTLVQPPQITTSE